MSELGDDRLDAAKRLGEFSDQLKLEQGGSLVPKPPAFAGPEGEPFGRQPKFPNLVRRETRPMPAPQMGDNTGMASGDPGAWRATVLRMLETLRRRLDELYRRLGGPQEEATTQAIGGNGEEVDVARDDTDDANLGSATTLCNITYAVTAKDGSPLGSHIPITGHGQRLFRAKYIPGTKGRGYRSAGTFVLTWVDETMDSFVCVPPES